MTTARNSLKLQNKNGIIGFYVCETNFYTRAQRLRTEENNNANASSSFTKYLSYVRMISILNI